MAAKPAGTLAPEFALKEMNSNQPTALKDALARGPVLLAFFKVSCPVCQFAFPFLERIYQAYKQNGVQIWGISQDDAADSRDYAKEYGCTFPILPDTGRYEVSNLYGLTNVPTLFLIESNGEISVTSVGFSKSEIEDVSQRLARSLGAPAFAPFRPQDNVPDFKPG